MLERSVIGVALICFGVCLVWQEIRQLLKERHLRSALTRLSLVQGNVFVHEVVRLLLQHHGPRTVRGWSEGNRRVAWRGGRGVAYVAPTRYCRFRLRMGRHGRTDGWASMDRRDAVERARSYS